jgi:hypothetical protein
VSHLVSHSRHRHPRRLPSLLRGSQCSPYHDPHNLPSPVLCMADRTTARVRPLFRLCTQQLQLRHLSTIHADSHNSLFSLDLSGPVVPLRNSHNSPTNNSRYTECPFQSSLRLPNQAQSRRQASQGKMASLALNLVRHKVDHLARCRQISKACVLSDNNSQDKWEHRHLSSKVNLILALIRHGWQAVRRPVPLGLALNKDNSKGLARIFRFIPRTMVKIRNQRGPCPSFSTKSLTLVRARTSRRKRRVASLASVSCGRQSNLSSDSSPFRADHSSKALLGVQ